MTLMAARLYTCPTCGQKWEADEIREETVSAKREYCQACVEKLDTAARRWEWFAEHGGSFKRLAMYYLTNDPRGYLAIEPESVIAWAREADPDGFDDALYDFIYKVSGDKVEYWAWLLAHN